MLTCPGVPDLYQGTELWDLSLVDPDNRRPVDYARRRGCWTAWPTPGARPPWPADARRRPQALADPPGARPPPPPPRVLTARVPATSRYSDGARGRQTSWPLRAATAWPWSSPGWSATSTARMGGHHGRAPAGPVGRRAHRRAGGRRPGRRGGLLRTFPVAVLGRTRDRAEGEPGAPCTSSRVWAPWQGQRRRCHRRARAADAARAVAAGGRVPSTMPDRAPDYAFRVDGGPARAGPPLALPARRHRRPVPGRRPRRPSPGPTAAGGGCRCPGRCCTSCHVGTFSAEGTFDAAIERLDHLVGLGVDAIELHAGRRVLRDRADGATTASTCSPRITPTAAPTGSSGFVDAAIARPRRRLRRRLQPPRARQATIWPEFGPYFSERTSTPWGAAVNFDGRRQPRGAPLCLRQRADVAARLPLRRAAPRRGARHLRRLRDPHPRAARQPRSMALAARSGRPLFLIAESDLNDPRFVARPRLGGLRDGRAVGRRLAPRAARRADRRPQRLLRGLRLSAAAGQGAAPGVGVRRHLLAVPSTGPRPRHRSACRATSSSSSPRTTTRSATAPTASAAAR